MARFEIRSNLLSPTPSYTRLSLSVSPPHSTAPPPHPHHNCGAQQRSWSQVTHGLSLSLPLAPLSPRFALRPAPSVVVGRTPSTPFPSGTTARCSRPPGSPACTRTGRAGCISPAPCTCSGTPRKKEGQGGQRGGSAPTGSFRRQLSPAPLRCRCPACSSSLVCAWDYVW